MNSSANTSGFEWGCRWQSALAQAMGPVREVSLTRGELFRTGESGMFAIDGASPGDEVTLHDRRGSYSDSIISSPRPSPQEGAKTWLRILAARASTLHERLDNAQMTAILPDDENFLQARLALWASRVAVGNNSSDFERYLRYEGLNECDALRGLGPVQLKDDESLPAWASTISEALFEACYDPLPDVCDPIRPIPFESLLLPFVHVFLRRLGRQVSEIHCLLKSTAWNAMARYLLEALSVIARDALYIEFCRYRLADFAPLAPFVYREPDALYRRFVDQMRAGGLFALYEAYPVLARCLARQTDLFVAVTDEFLRRLAFDLPAISELWEIKEPVPVTEVRVSLSDPHRGGHQVLGVTFASGLRLIYKPKDLGIDLAYNAFLVWLKSAGAPIVVRPLQVLNCRTHGWVECVETAPCGDQFAVTRYYQRAGALMCLAYVFQGSDCHAENLIAADEDPVLVDCETLLNPWPHIADVAGAGDLQRTALDRLLRDSVLTSGLLPSLGDDDERTFSTPGLCRIIVLRAGKITNRWAQINTDAMTISQVAIRLGVANNLPYVDGAPAEVGENIEALVKGFSAMYRFLVAQRPALFALNSPLAAFRGQFVRFLFRETHLYAILTGLAMRPYALSDGVDHSLCFELLARAFLISEQRPSSWPILAAERKALLCGDIPFFGAYTDQTALLLENGERIEDYFVCPSYDAMLTKLRNLNEQDLEFQIGLIRAAIAVYADLQARETAAIAMQTLGRTRLDRIGG